MSCLCKKFTGFEVHDYAAVCESKTNPENGSHRYPTLSCLNKSLILSPNPHHMSTSFTVTIKSQTPSLFTGVYSPNSQFSVISMP